MTGGIGQRRMQRNEIRACQQRIELDFFDIHRRSAFAREEGIKRDHLHFEALCAVGHDAADIPAADEAEGFPSHFHAHEFILFPLTSMRAGVGFGNLPRHGHHQ